MCNAKTMCGEEPRSTRQIQAFFAVAMALVALLACTCALAPERALAAEAANKAQVVASDGSVTGYASIVDAVNAAPDGSTVQMIADEELGAASGSPMVNITKSLTIDGQGHTLTVHNKGVYVYGSDDESNPYNVVIKDITVTNPDTLGRTIMVTNGYKNLAIDNATLETTGGGNTQVLTIGGNTPYVTDVVIKDSTLKASKSGYAVITFNPVDMTIDHSNLSGYAAIYMKGPDNSAGSSGSVIEVVNGSVLSSQGIAGETDSFGTVVVEQCHDVKLNVQDSTVQVTADDAEPPTPQSAIVFSAYTTGDDTSKDNTVTFDKGSTVEANGTYSALVQGNGASNEVDAKAGDYRLEGDVFAQEGAPAGVKLNVTGGTWSKDPTEYVTDGTPVRHDGDDAPYVVGDSADTDQGDGGEGTHDGGNDGAAADGSGDGTGSGGRDVVTGTPIDQGADASPASIDVSSAADLALAGDDETPLLALAAAAAVALAAMIVAFRRNLLANRGV